MKQFYMIAHKDIGILDAVAYSTKQLALKTLHTMWPDSADYEVVPVGLIEE